MNPSMEVQLIMILLGYIVAITSRDPQDEDETDE